MKHTLIQSVTEEPQAFSGCSHGPMPARKRAANAPPVFVNGVEIPEADIAREAQNHAAASGAEARGAAAQALIIRELLLQRARALNLTPEARTDERCRSETYEEALTRTVLETEVETREPSDEECQRFYRSAPERFRAPELYEASHILFGLDEPGAAGWVSAHGRAAACISAIASGADFSAFARRLSACPSAALGGSLGQMQAGDLAPEIEAALLGLDPGEVAAAPVRTAHGWHVLRLDRRVGAHVLPYDAVAPRIRHALRDRAWTAAATRYVDNLAHAASIEGAVLSLGGGDV